MSLQKKCLTASAIAHGLVILLVIVGSAFVPQQPRITGPEFEIVNIPMDLVEEPNVLSGVPDAGSAQPVQTSKPNEPLPQLPPAEPQPRVKPEPPVKLPEPVKEPRPREPAPEPEKGTKAPTRTVDPDDFDLTKAKTVKAPVKPEPDDSDFDLTKAKSKRIQSPADNARSSDNSRTPERSNQQAARLAQVLEGARKTLEGTGSRVGISYSDIIGSGGRAQMSYDLAVAKIYEAEFKRHPLPSRSNDSAVQVEVTVRRDGTILREEVVKRSGRAQLDRIVDTVLKNVNKAIPFPTDFTSDTRTIRINFNPDDSFNG